MSACSSIKANNVNNFNNNYNNRLITLCVRVRARECEDSTHLVWDHQTDGLRFKTSST